MGVFNKTVKRFFDRLIVRFQVSRVVIALPIVTPIASSISSMAKVLRRRFDEVECEAIRTISSRSYATYAVFACGAVKN